MAVVTQAAPAGQEEDKELLISGSEAVAEALTLADLDIGGAEITAGIPGENAEHKTI